MHLFTETLFFFFVGGVQNGPLRHTADDPAEYTFPGCGVCHVHSVPFFKFLGFKILSSKFLKAR